MRELIPYEFLVYNEIDTAREAILTVAQPSDPEAFNAVFERYAHQHPLLTHYQATRDPSVLQLSEHISVSALHQLDLYNEFFRHVGIENQIVCTVPATRNVAIGLVLTRDRGDFSAEECELLAMLRPSVIRAYRSARRHAEVQRRVNALNGALEARGQAVIILDANGEVENVSAQAEQLLATYGAGPADLVARRFRNRETRTVARIGGHLTITSTGAALLLDENLGPFTPGRLGNLGISAREADVLRWLADGASNQAIADRLGIALRTVKKHLERIYEKLGVDSRTAAIARVRGAAG